MDEQFEARYAAHTKMNAAERSVKMNATNQKELLRKARHHRPEGYKLTSIRSARLQVLVWHDGQWFPEFVSRVFSVDD